MGGRPFDFSNLWGSDRGLTGSELSCFCFARELAKLGHEISLYVEQPGIASFDNVALHPLSDLGGHGARYDAVCSWNEPDYLRHVSPRTLRLVDQQLNDCAYMQPGYDDFVDVWTSPSEAHRQRNLSLSPHKWVVLPNGCYPEKYDLSTPKAPGRVVYASSPDRGLHLLFQEWPKIKKAVPHAELFVFYHSLEQWIERCRGIRDSSCVSMDEQGCRARYMEAVLPRVKKLGAEIVGSISHDRLAQELAMASVLGYPCDTIAWTEGFSVATLEGCVSGALPITSSVDALGEIYGGHVPMVEAPARDHMGEWSDLVIRALTDEPWRKEWAHKARLRAEQFAWPALAKQLEQTIVDGLSKKVVPKRVPTMHSAKECVFRGMPYKIAYEEKHPQDATWFTFEDETSVRDTHWHVDKNDCVIDVGAAYGSYTLTALSQGAARVYAWSPEGAPNSDSEAEFLQESLALNGWSDRCVVYGTGAYDKIGWIDAYTQEFYENDPPIRSNVIPVERLDTWYEREFLVKDDAKKYNRFWLKLDVEGAEVAVLSAAERLIRELRPNILVENHNFKRPTIEQEVRDLIVAYGYREIATTPYHSVSHSFYVPEIQ